MTLETGRLVYPGVSLDFGEDTPRRIRAFQRGTADRSPNSYAVPRGDSERFGPEFKGGATHALSIRHMARGNPDEARRLVAELEAAWNALQVRRRGGELAQLWIGGDRFALGRPGAVTPDDRELYRGFAESHLEFRAESDQWYGPEERTPIRLVPEYSGGLVVPAAVPFVLGGGEGEGQYLVTVSGTNESWPVLELHGPIQNPYIEIVGVGRLRFDVTVAYDQTLVVDTRPFARWVKRDDVPVPGALSTAGDRLSDFALDPGAYQVFFGGYDPSGTSWLDVVIWPTYPTF